MGRVPSSISLSNCDLHLIAAGTHNDPAQHGEQGAHRLVGRAQRLHFHQNGARALQHHGDAKVDARRVATIAHKQGASVGHSLQAVLAHLEDAHLHKLVVQLCTPACMCLFQCLQELNLGATGTRQCAQLQKARRSSAAQQVLQRKM